MAFAQYLIVSYRISWQDGIYSAVIADYRQRRILARAKASPELGEILTHLDDLAQDLATENRLPVKIENYFFDPVEKGIYLEKQTFEPANYGIGGSVFLTPQTGSSTRPAAEMDFLAGVAKIFLYWMLVATLTVLLRHFYQLSLLQSFGIALVSSVIPFLRSLMSVMQYSATDVKKTANSHNEMEKDGEQKALPAARTLGQGKANEEQNDAS